jgi:hypothetical protein
MAPQYGFALFVIGVAAVIIVVVTILYPRTIQEYWQQLCMGRAWKRTFSRASKDEIRQFLYMFVDAFAFPKHRALPLAHTDRVLTVLARLFGVLGILVGITCLVIAYAITENRPLNMGAGTFAIVMGIAFLLTKSFNAEQLARMRRRMGRPD